MATLTTFTLPVQGTSGLPQQAIGKVKIIIGTATGTGSDGAAHILQVGDPVYANDVIMTSPLGAVEIEFRDGAVLDLGRNSQSVLDSEVFNPAAAQQAAAAATLTAEQIQAMIAAGADPTQIAQATAAGAGGPGDEGGHSFVVIDPLNPLGHVTSGFDTTGISVTFTTPGGQFILVPPEHAPESNPPLVANPPPLIALPSVENPPPVSGPPGSETPPPGGGETPPGGGETPPGGGETPPGGGGTPVNHPTEAELQVSTSLAHHNPQSVEVTITETGDTSFAQDMILADTTAHQVLPLSFDDGFVLSADKDYTITVDYLAGPNVIHVTGLTLTDADGNIDFTVNPFMGHHDDFDFDIGGKANEYDGGIYLLTHTADPADVDWNVSLPLGYKIADSNGDGIPELRLDSAWSNTAGFSADLAELGVSRLHGMAQIDIAGNFLSGNSDQEDNSLTLNANDVLNFTGSNMLTILGDGPPHHGPGGDVVNLVDQDGAGSGAWTNAGSSGGLTAYNYAEGAAILASVLVDSDVTVHQNVIA